MSETPHAHSGAVQEEEHLAYGKIIGVAIAALLAFALVIVWSTSILHSTEREMHPKGTPPLPSMAGKYEVGIVNQKPFVDDGRAALKRNQQLERLNSYGWVDRQAGQVHIPIEQAMQLEIARERAQTPAPQAPAPQTPAPQGTP
jgi:hypothetical protein